MASRLALSHDTRDSPFLPTQGHLLSVDFEEVVGSFQYPHVDVQARQYYLLRQRADGSGRHVFSIGGEFGVTGDDTPIYDNFFPGGFSSLRGFAFRGAAPSDGAVIVGGQFELLGTAEYMFPITADDALRGVVFCDFGTAEKTVAINGNQFRVAPGFGLRINVPAMGPAPIALDFAVPVDQCWRRSGPELQLLRGLRPQLLKSRRARFRAGVSARWRILESSSAPAMLQADPLAGAPLMLFAPHVKTKPLAEFLRRMAISLEAGIDRAYCIGERSSTLVARAAQPRRSHSPQRRRRLVDGRRHERHRRLFPALVRELVVVGEQTGHLPEVLKQLTEHYDEQLVLRRVFIRAIAWPMMQLTMALVVVGLLIYIMGWLPATGRDRVDLLGFGLRGTSGLIVYLLFLAAVAASIYVFIRAIAAGKLWTAHVQRLLLRLPQIGKALRTLAVARFAWTLQLALEAAMDVKHALSLALASTHNIEFTRTTPKHSGRHPARRYHPRSSSGNRRLSQGTARCRAGGRRKRPPGRNLGDRFPPTTRRSPLCTVAAHSLGRLRDLVSGRAVDHHADFPPGRILCWRNQCGRQRQIAAPQARFLRDCAAFQARANLCIHLPILADK